MVHCVQFEELSAEFTSAVYKPVYSFSAFAWTAAVLARSSLKINTAKGGKHKSKE
jgi:hypothetical protein